MDTAALSLQNLPQIMSKPRNIILIVADSLRYDSVYGAGETQSVYTPYLNNNAVQFAQARSSGCWTLPATASLFTGLMPHQHGATSQTRNVNPNVPTLAQRLKAAGYNTLQITANVATTDIFGLHRGFDEIRRIWQLVPAKFNRLQQLLVMVGKPRMRKMLLSKDAIANKLTEDLKVSTTWLQNTHEDVFNEARRTLAENEKKGQNTFLFLNLMETHFPYHVAPTFETTADSILGRLREIYSLFHVVNQSFLKTGKIGISSNMLSLIKQRQRLSWEIIAPALDSFVQELHQDKDNLVIFAADHGDNFGEQNWLYHFSNVNDAGNKVPVFWLSHNRTHSPQTVNLPVNSKDLYHAILQACHLPAEGDGISITDAPEASCSVMQSFWYNNHGKTLPQFKYNQICFVEGNQRYLHRHGQWFTAPITELGQAEPLFIPIPRNIHPVYEHVEDPRRRQYFLQTLADFNVFSDKIGTGR
jgi:hypothetical protein